MPTLTRAAMASFVHEHTELTQAQSRVMVDEILRIMAEGLRKDGNVLLSGFGKFEAYQKKERRGRNPQTSESVMLPARKVVVFRLSRLFRDELNKGED